MTVGMGCMFVCGLYTCIVCGSGNIPFENAHTGLLTEGVAIEDHLTRGK